MLAIFIDIETNGLDPYQHFPIDFACKIVQLQDGLPIELDQYQTLIAPDPEQWDKSDAESLAVNGYCWDEVATGKLRSCVCDEVIALFQKHQVQRGRDLFICQNPSFDRPFFAKLVDVYIQEKLHWPYHWLDLASMYWLLHHKRLIGNEQKISLSKNQIAAYYGLPEEATPHRAINGVEHLILCYKAVVEEMNRSLQQL